VKKTKQLTAVEWLVEQVEQISNNKNLSKQEYIDLYNKAIEQAKEMEKKQIMDAHKEGCFDNILDEKTDKVRAEQYYSETFNK
jgi:hypothetical protein